MLGHLEDDRSENIQETEQGHDNALSESAGSSHCACIQDSSIDADIWVKAAEFVPGQQWQSVGK